MSNPKNDQPKAVFKAFHVDEETIFAAVDIEQAATTYKDWCGEECESPEYPRELTDSELDHQHQAFDEDENPIKGQSESPREWLEGVTEPGFLAGPQY